MYHIAILALLSQLSSAAPSNVDARQSSTLTVDLGTTYQTMDGFGFSQAFGRANDLYNLPSTQRKQALDLLFNTTSGASMSILRNRIGSGTTSSDSIEPSNPGSPSATPKYSWDGNDTHQVWVSQQALTYGVKTFYADAWSAPGFMKTNGQETNGGYLCGVDGETCSSGDWKQAYANMLVQYVHDYASVGIPITHLGFLNEPDYTASYSSMLSSGTQAASFIKVLAQTVRNAGLNVSITCCDATGWSVQSTMTAQLISAGVESSLSVITSHAYSSDPTSPLSTSLRTWQTENADLSDSWTATWYSDGGKGEGLTWARKIYTAIVDAQLSAYLYWEGIEVGTTNSCLIQISDTTVNASGRLWAFAQWSRFVRPGAIRVATSGASSLLLTSAFHNTDGSVAVQVINTGSSAQTVSVATTGGGFTASSVTVYITDNDNNGLNALTANLSGGTASASVPDHAFVTFVLAGKDEL